ncbi:hypothetical protein [Deinococcus arenicola]|uniref:DUF2937 family protein n=1 Tax=Deinococcus arenicola TaxID=2994950 RepID=A0ABU4DMT6_9DEIO|nr:hypothetical protein [Deinococcus sp. ZS9-10]MDV6372994.1 hypothetical protein [Deinococcus sp. ZS9-10]
MKARRRHRLARRVGLGGLWLAAVLVLSAWLGVFITLIPLRAALERTDQQLVTLETRLGAVQATLAPFDPLADPQTLEAVGALRRLAEGARAAPFLDRALGKDALDSAVTLTTGWETALRTRPPLPALAEARESAAAWRQTVQRTATQLTLGAWALCGLFTLLGAWFAAGQWALYRLAGERLSERTHHPAK